MTEIAIYGVLITVVVVSSLFGVLYFRWNPKGNATRNTHTEPEGVVVRAESPYRVVRTLPINIAGVVRQKGLQPGGTALLTVQIEEAELEKFGLNKHISISGEHFVEEAVVPDFMKPQRGDTPAEIATKLLKAGHDPRIVAAAEMEGDRRRELKDAAIRKEIEKGVDEMAKDMEKEKLETPKTLPESGPSENHTLPEIPSDEEQIEMKKENTAVERSLEFADRHKALGEDRKKCTKCHSRNWGKIAEPFVCNHCVKKEEKEKKAEAKK